MLMIPCGDKIAQAMLLTFLAATRSSFHISFDKPSFHSRRILLAKLVISLRYWVFTHPEFETSSAETNVLNLNFRPPSTSFTKKSLFSEMRHFLSLRTEINLCRVTHMSILRKLTRNIILAIFPALYKISFFLTCCHFCHSSCRILGKPSVPKVVVA